MRIAVLLLTLQFIFTFSFAQVDTTLVYNPSTPYGPLDIRIVKSASHRYYLQEGKTFSFRENNGTRTDSYLDMTAWDSDRYTQGNMRESKEGVDSFVMNYRLLKPQNYNASYAQGYPLVLVLHGLQERGNCAGSKCYHASVAYSPNQNIPAAPTSSNSSLLNNDYNLAHGGSNYLEAHVENGNSLPDDPNLSPRAFPGFVLFPQNLNGWDAASAEDAIRLVRLMIKQYNIDINRVYINGVSNGGYGAYEAMKRAPWLFSAGILFSAADDASITTQNLESIIAGIPLWIFQGGVDKKPTPKQTERYVKELRRAGANVRYTLYEQVGHGTWNKAFAEPDFFSWMLRQKNRNIHVFANNPAVCATSGNGALLSLPKGYQEYQWELNGQIAEGEVTSQLIARTPGAYRARVRSFDNGWNAWSDVVNVVEKNPSPPIIAQVGTVVLKDPNNGNEAVLEADGNFAHYYWYKNDVLVNLPGGTDDTLKIATIKSSYGDGVYTLRTADYDNCISAPSTPKYVFFNDRAPINITTPEAISISNQNPSSVLISWKDVSNNETGFEIWRRQPNVPDSLWSMAALTAEGVTSFTDGKLSPSSVYEYIIRAVSNSARSAYTARSRITTLADNEAPSTPAGLTAEIKGVEKLLLKWNSSTDKSAIKEYIIFSALDTIKTGSADTSFVLSQFAINTNYSFHVKAVDVGGNISEASNNADIYTRIVGLFYEHSTGDWNSLEEIDWSIAEFTGVIDRFSLEPKTQEDFFNIRFDGFLNVEDDGVYQFRISSNDGSRLFFNDTLLISNDGIHNFATVTAPIQILPAGPHRLTVDFFDNVLTDSLLVEYKGPDTNNEWVLIPSEKLSSDVITSLEADVFAEVFDFSIYPNPSRTTDISISFSTPETTPINISLIANTGQRIRTLTVDDPASRQQITFELSQILRGGFYFIQAEQNGVRKTKKLLVIE